MLELGCNCTNYAINGLSLNTCVPRFRQDNAVRVVFGWFAKGGRNKV